MIINDAQIVYLLTNDTTANSVSEPVNRANYKQHALQFISAGVGTLLVEGSLDGTNFATIDAQVEPNSIIQIEGRYQWFRVTRDGLTDAVTVLLAGYDQEA